MTEEAKTVADGDAEETWAYAGQRYNVADKKLQQLFYTIDEAGVVDNKRTHVFQKGAVKGAFCGAVYKVTTTKGGESVWTAGAKGPKYLRRHSDKAQISEWEALEYAARAQNEERLALKSDADKSAFEDALQPIARAMRKTNWQGRRAIILWVTSFLSKEGGF